MRQELACSYESFLQEMKSNQLTFSSSSPYLNEIESTLFNVPLFSSPSSTFFTSFMISRIMVIFHQSSRQLLPQQPGS